jgi:hypothetical protein
MIRNDEPPTDELLRAALQRLHDQSDALRAIATAARLIVDGTDTVEEAIIELARRANR